MTRLSAWFRRDEPTLLADMRALWPTVQTARVCCDARTGEAWDRPDGRERIDRVYRVLRSVLRRAA